MSSQYSNGNLTFITPETIPLSSTPRKTTKGTITLPIQNTNNKIDYCCAFLQSAAFFLCFVRGHLSESRRPSSQTPHRLKTPLVFNQELQLSVFSQLLGLCGLHQHVSQHCKQQSCSVIWTDADFITAVSDTKEIIHIYEFILDSSREPFCQSKSRPFYLHRIFSLEVQLTFKKMYI